MEFKAMELNDRMRHAASEMTDALSGMTPEEGMATVTYFFLLMNAAMCHRTGGDPGRTAEALSTVVRMQFDVIYQAYAESQTSQK